jgi:hypothetical protein
VKRKREKREREKDGWREGGRERGRGRKTMTEGEREREKRGRKTGEKYKADNKREICERLDVIGQRQWRLSSTLHVYRTPRVQVAADAKLPVIVLAPALDPAPRRIDEARVAPTQGDGDGGDAWRVWGQ